MARLGQSLCAALAAAGCLAPADVRSAHRSESAPSSEHFTDLSLEELLKVSVTTVSRTSGSLREAPAAVAVVTQDDLRSTGVQRLPEALRLVPGMNVAQSTAAGWAVSARGFNDLYANKLLVMRDGRSIYTPLFSGVYWNNHNPLIEDIERIEVVRGPGATVWGANAVNGVVNIVSKSAFDTLGGLVSAGAGTELEGNISTRYGFKLGETAAVRLSFRQTWTDDSVLADGSESWDDDRIISGGFRADWKPNDRNTATLIGEVHTEAKSGRYIQPSFFPPYSTIVRQATGSDGGFVHGIWQHDLSADTAITTQLSFDHYRNFKEMVERRDTGSVELQLTTSALSRHTLSVGLELRTSRDDITPSPFLLLMPHKETYNLLSTFVQDEVSLVEDRLKLTYGSKFEFNSDGDFEPQPGVRLAWTPSEKATLWASVSSAARTPSRGEKGGRALSQIIPPGAATPPNPLPVAIIQQGQDGAQTEQLVAFETGLRLKAMPKLNLDFAAFYNSYRHVQSVVPSPVTLQNGPNGPYLESIQMIANALEGDTYGFEASADWHVLDHLRLRASYSLLESHLRPTEEGIMAVSSQSPENSPNQQVSLGATWTPAHKWEVSSSLRWVDRLGDGSIPSYFGLDLRVSWTPRPGLEFSIIGKDLLEDRHAEFSDDRLIPTGKHEVQRGVYGQVTWKF